VLAGSDGVLGSKLIREAGGNNFDEKICILNSRTLSK